MFENHSLKSELQSISVNVIQKKLMEKYTKVYENFPILISIINTKLMDIAKAGYNEAHFLLYRNIDKNHEEYIGSGLCRREYERNELLLAIQEFYQYDDFNVSIRPTYEFTISWSKKSYIPDTFTDDAISLDIFAFFKTHYANMICEKNY